jgi:hypothetical protein
MSNECITESARTQDSGSSVSAKKAELATRDTLTDFGQIIASKLQSQVSKDEVAAHRQDHVIANAYQDE